VSQSASVAYSKRYKHMYTVRTRVCALCMLKKSVTQLHNKITSSGACSAARHWQRLIAAATYLLHHIAKAQKLIQRNEQ
jgi:hypothetical protein